MVAAGVVTLNTVATENRIRDPRRCRDGLSSLWDDGRRHVIQLPAIVRRGLENFAGRPTRN